MRRRLAAGCLAAALGAAGGAHAQALCDDLWFSRNAAYDSVGYCFQSPLGQAVFDNADCTGAPPVVGPEADARIARIRTQETLFDCRVDTDRESLDLPLLDRRRPLEVQPVRRVEETLCVGYIGPPIPLRAAPEPGAEVIGTIEPGDSILMRHEAEGDWFFASQVARAESEQVALGWHDMALDTCEARTG